LKGYTEAYWVAIEKGGPAGVLHITAAPAFVDMRLADALVN